MRMRVKNILVPALMLLFFIALGVALSSHSHQLTRTGVSGPEMTPPLPAKLAFAGEDVPLSYFWVAEGYDRELLVNMHWHSSTIMLLKRAHRYLPVIEPILKQEGVPDDFKYLAVIESNLLPAVSPAGATGIWQFLKKTGQAYGLRINDDVDERYHLEKATVAACRYLKEARDTFGSWTMAAAAYNAGIPGIRRSQAEQKAGSYYDMWLNTETSRYIHRILAIKTIFEDPVRYGYDIPADRLYKPLQVNRETMSAGIENLAVYAQSKGISYRALKELNPWMRSNKLPHPGLEPYTILLPLEEGRWYQP